MDTLDPKKLALEISSFKDYPGRKKLKLPRHRQGEKFLKGPVPWRWLEHAAQLPGKSLHVALALWFLAGLNKSATVKLGQQLANDLGIDRRAKDRALKWLTQAELISVQAQQGCAPVITLLDMALDSDPSKPDRKEGA